MKKDMSWYTSDKKNLPWFVAGYDFYPFLSPRQGWGIENTQLVG
jgi:hypothetical protein